MRPRRHGCYGQTGAPVWPAGAERNHSAFGLKPPRQLVFRALARFRRTGQLPKVMPVMQRFVTVIAAAADGTWTMTWSMVESLEAEISSVGVVL